MKENAQYLIWYSYGELERQGTASFQRFFSEKKLYRKWKSLCRNYDSIMKRYCGNSHADTSHLDYEVEHLYSLSDFIEYCEDHEWAIDWETGELVSISEAESSY